MPINLTIIIYVIFFGMLTVLTPPSFAQNSMGLCRIGLEPTVSVSSENDLRTALSQAAPGTTIVITSGNYRGDFTLEKSGTDTHPITVRASDNVKFTDTVFKLEGDYSVLMGITFENGMVSILGDYNRVTGNVFQNGKTGGNSSKLHSAVHTEGGASYNRIDHNEVVNWQRRALRNTRLNSRTRGNRFDHNYVHNMLGEWANSGEAFQVGTGHSDPQYTPETIFEYNLVDGHNLEGEVVSLKAHGSIIRGNTFMNAEDGTVQSRYANHSIFINNTLIRVKSLSIYGDHNQVIGNALTKADIRLRSGDVIGPNLLDENSNGTYKYQGAHPAARYTVVAGNVLSDGDIRLGKEGTGKLQYYPPTYPVEDTTLAENTGASVIIEGPVTGTINLSSYDGAIGEPAQLTPSQVGPGADDPMCTEGSNPTPVILAAPQNFKTFMARP